MGVSFSYVEFVGKNGIMHIQKKKNTGKKAGISENTHVKIQPYDI